MFFKSFRKLKFLKFINTRKLKKSVIIVHFSTSENIIVVLFAER